MIYLIVVSCHFNHLFKFCDGLQEISVILNFHLQNQMSRPLVTRITCLHFSWCQWSLPRWGFVLCPHPPSVINSRGVSKIQKGFATKTPHPPFSL